MKRFNLRSAPKASKTDSPGLKVAARDGADCAELVIFDEIGENWYGEGVSAVDVREFLDSHKDERVSARINSFGGSVYEGLAIYNAFLDHGNVHGCVEGIAYSAASIVAMGCSHLAMKKASDIGIHHAWTFAMGNSIELKATIEWLDAVDSHQAEIFMEKTGASERQVNEWLDGTDDGTIFTATKALELGFCDEIIERKTNDDDQGAQAKGKLAANVSARLYQQRVKAFTRK